MIFSRALPLFLALFPAFVLSDYDFRQNDVPQRCRSICEPVANLTQTCDVSANRTNNETISSEAEDRLQRQCICTNDSFDVANRTALCAGCVDQTSNSTNSTTGGGNNSTNSTGQANLSSIMSVCGFSSESFASNMTTATSANVTATRPTGTGQLTTTISTGVPHTGGGGGGGGGGAGPDETEAPGAAAQIGMSNVGFVGALLAGVMIGL